MIEGWNRMALEFGLSCYAPCYLPTRGNSGEALRQTRP